MFWKKKEPARDEIEMAYDLIRIYRSRLLPYYSIYIMVYEPEFNKFLKMIGMFNLYVDCMEHPREPEKYTIPICKYNSIRRVISMLCSESYPNYAVLQFYMGLCKDLKIYEMLKQDIHSKNFRKLIEVFMDGI